MKLSNHKKKKHAGRQLSPERKGSINTPGLQTVQTNQKYRSCTGKPDLLLLMGKKRPKNWKQWRVKGNRDTKKISDSNTRVVNCQSS